MPDARLTAPVFQVITTEGFVYGKGRLQGTCFKYFDPSSDALGRDASADVGRLDARSSERIRTGHRLLLGQVFIHERHGTSVALSFVSEEGSMLFKDLVATWFSTVAAVTLKPSGYKSYEAICNNHLLPAYGDMPIETITAAGVQAYVADKVESGLSPRTVANHVQVMRRLMAYATGSGLIESNPLASVATPRQESAAARLRYLTPKQLRQLLEATPPAWRVLIATAFMTGLRKGEQLALTFKDVDFEKRTISVNKTIRGGIVTSPKTPWSVGALPLPESLVPLLEERRRKAPDPDGLIFCRKDGSPLADSLPNRVCGKALEAAGLPRVSWHEMGRHSWVVAHLQAGTDIPTLQRLGRWKTADVLLSTYAHVLPSAGGDAVRRLDELMSQQ